MYGAVQWINPSYSNPTTITEELTYLARFSVYISKEVYIYLILSMDIDHQADHLW